MIILTELHVTRMHGCWNKYGVVEDLDRRIEKELEDVGGYGGLAKSTCHPSYGLGSDGNNLDGILVLNSGDKTDYRMRIFNPDGSPAEMCGNGARILARYLFEKGMTSGREFKVEAYDGSIKFAPRINLDSAGEVESVTVDMGKGKLVGKEGIQVFKPTGVYYEGDVVSVGNPHFVIFTEDASEEMARLYGPSIEYHDLFKPYRTNVEFAKIIFDDSDSWIDLYVWERGAGLTKACGTGACATALAAYKDDKINRKTKVALPGGVLDISIGKDDKIRMTGPAEYLDDTEKCYQPDVREYVAAQPKGGT